MDNLVLHYTSDNELEVSDKSEIEINEERCSICYDSLKDKQSHKLSCNHSFHTDCIIDWFRMGNSSCPYCRDTVSNQSSFIKTKWKVTFLRNYSKRKNAPKILIKHVLLLKKEEEKYKTLTKNITELSKSSGKLNELLTKKRRLIGQKWRCFRNIRNYKKTLIELNIIPLIVKK